MKSRSENHCVLLGLTFNGVEQGRQDRTRSSCCITVHRRTQARACTHARRFLPSLFISLFFIKPVYEMLCTMCKEARCSRCDIKLSSSSPRPLPPCHAACDVFDNLLQTVHPLTLPDHQKASNVEPQFVWQERQRRCNAIFAQHHLFQSSVARQGVQPVVGWRPYTEGRLDQAAHRLVRLRLSNLEEGRGGAVAWVQSVAAVAFAQQPFQRALATGVDSNLELVERLACHVPRQHICRLCGLGVMCNGLAFAVGAI